MKIKEQKAQALAFAHAVSGMAGVKFSGVRTAKDFWHIPLLEKNNHGRGLDKAETTENQLMDVLKHFKN